MYTDGVSIHLTVYIVYIHLNESKLLLESIEVNICAIDYLSHCCHTCVTPFSGQCDR